MITTLAIDPSAGINKRHAVAMYHDKVLHSVGLVSLDGNLFGIYHDGMRLAIEGQFQGLNSKSVIGLARGCRAYSRVARVSTASGEMGATSRVEKADIT